MHVATTEGDCLLVGNVVLSLSVIFGQIAQYQCKKHSPSPKDYLQSHQKPVQNWKVNVNLLNPRALPSLCFLKQPDLRMAQILYPILLPTLLISILKRFLKVDFYFVDFNLFRKYPKCTKYVISCHRTHLA